MDVSKSRHASFSSAAQRSPAWYLTAIFRLLCEIGTMIAWNRTGQSRRSLSNVAWPKFLEADMSVGESLFGIHATALQLRSQRMSMLASNIANAATPNYKARDMDFAQALRQASDGESIESAIQYRVPLQPSLDGNTVEMSTEQTAFAENALAYRSSLSFLQGRVGTMMRALKGE